MFRRTRLSCFLASMVVVGVIAAEAQAGWYHYGRAARRVAGCASIYNTCAGFYSTCEMFHSSDCGSATWGCIGCGKRLASDWSDDPSIWFEDGLYLYRTGRYYEALGRIQYAAEQDPNQAKYYYLLALAQRQVGLQDEAMASVQVAADLERPNPIQSWGRMMERYQGYSRVWLDEARQDALRQPPAAG
jgi:tetratricopeptide (TPR) repeat protein